MKRVTVTGRYNEAVIYTDEVEESALRQIERMCNLSYLENSRIRIMPDVHAGKSCTVGTTLTIRDKIAPAMVGVDIGCGMETVILKEHFIEVQKLDKVIHCRVPSGFGIRKTAHPYHEDIDLGVLRCRESARISISQAQKSIGTLGGGNHFIEAGKDEDGVIYLIVHSGSRKLGLEVARYYQEAAADLSDSREKLPRDFAYVTGRLMEDYLFDMKLVQRFADLNRKAIVNEIVRGMKWKVEHEFTTVHNYIDTESMVLRKGAVSAKKGEQLLIPINMRDGSLLCIGKGNEEWNQSAPHGAGRKYGRNAAKSLFTLSEYKKQMRGIYSSTINRETLDECPMAYKEKRDIVSAIHPTAEVQKRIRPVYNFKAGNES